MLMSAMLSFNSRNIKCKNPFGAVPLQQKIKISFPVNKSISLIGVSLLLRKDNSITNIPLSFLRDDGNNNVFFAEVVPPSVGVYYYRFEIYTLEGTIFIGKGRDGGALIGDWLPEWQLTVYSMDLVTPDWIKGGIIYHIFADRFARIEDGKKPSKGVFKSWYQTLSIGDHRGYKADDFYGGNIKGIINKLPYLRSLGVTAIYLSPIFESFSNHRYDTGDYFKIDPLFGTEGEFEELIIKSKKEDISIILDGVFNHTGADSIYFNKFGTYDSVGAYQSQESPYYKWFTFSDWPDLYDCWWGVTVVPTVKRHCVEFQDLIAGKEGVLEKWTKLGVKGWRLDVVDEISSAFLEKITTKCKEISSEILVIGEVWEDASTKESYGEKRRYLLGGQLDGVMNYPFRDAIINLVKNRHIESFINNTYEICENYPKAVLDTCMTLVGSHDTVRVITEIAAQDKPRTKFARSVHKLNSSELAKGKEMLKIASILQYILPGVPTIYYGDEIGMQGYEDPINRATFSLEEGNKEILFHYRQLGLFRQRHKNILINAPIKMYSHKEILYVERGDLQVIINFSDRILNFSKIVFNEIDGKHYSYLKENAAIVILNRGHTK